MAQAALIRSPRWFEVDDSISSGQLLIAVSSTLATACSQASVKRVRHLLVEAEENGHLGSFRLCKTENHSLSSLRQSLCR